MKKSIFILAALFAATFANAQISLEFVFNGILTSKNSPMTNGGINGENTPYKFDDAPYIIGINWTCDTVSLFNKEDLSLYKNVVFDGGIKCAYCFAKGVYTTDQKVGFIIDYDRHYKIIDEEGNVLYDITEVIDGGIVYAEIVKVGLNYKLFISEKEGKTYVFSLPGNGESNTDISTPSSPKRNARKLLREGQVLVETENNTYDLKGQEVK